MKYLKTNNGEFLGIVGEPTNMTYEDGSTIHIGDVISKLSIRNEEENFLTFATNRGIWGLCGLNFANGLAVVWKIIDYKKFNEHSENKLNTVSIHEATIYDIAVKCETVDEKFKTIKLMQRLNGEKEDIINFSKDLLCNCIMLNEIKEVNACGDDYQKLNSKIIIDYPTLIQHFNDTKIEVEIKQIDNVVLRRVLKGDKNFSVLDFNDYPLWTVDEFNSIKDAEESIKSLQSLIDEINNTQPKLYDSLGQELHEGDEVEYIVFDDFNEGLQHSKIVLNYNKTNIGIFKNNCLCYSYFFNKDTRKPDNTKLYIRKVVI